MRPLAQEQSLFQANRPVPSSALCDAAESTDPIARHNAVAGDQRRQRIAGHGRRGCARRAASPGQHRELRVGAG
jgi:hypothetical protein